MTLTEHLIRAIEEHQQRHLLPALLQACAALDQTAERLFPDANGRDRFLWTVDQYLWLIEPLLGLGLNLEATTFRWDAAGVRPLRFAEVLYRIHRAGARIAPGVSICRSIDYPAARRAKQLTLPDTVTFALLAVVLFASINADQHGGQDYYLTHGTTHFPLDQWWGREAEARAYVARFEVPRIAMRL
jgi:hypothetical protein